MFMCLQIYENKIVFYKYVQSLKLLCLYLLPDL